MLGNFFLSPVVFVENFIKIFNKNRIASSKHLKQIVIKLYRLDLHLFYDVDKDISNPGIGRLAGRYWLPRHMSPRACQVGEKEQKTCQAF